MRKIALAFLLATCAPALAEHDSTDELARYILPNGYTKKFDKHDFKYVLVIERSGRIFWSNHYVTRTECIDWLVDAITIDPKSVTSATCTTVETIKNEMEEEKDNAAENP